MRPFRFFFMFALSIMLFFFIAKFVIGAFFIAAILSVIYFLFQKIRGFFYRLDWSKDYGYEYNEKDYRYNFSKWGNRHKAFGMGQNEPLFYEKGRPTDWKSDYRTITIG